MKSIDRPFYCCAQLYIMINSFNIFLSFMESQFPTPTSRCHFIQVNFKYWNVI